MVTSIEPASPADERCVCGEFHRVPIDSIVIDEEAVERLVSYAQQRRWSRPFIVMDANTEQVAGSRVIGALSRANMVVKTLCYPELHGLVADEDSVARLEAALKATETDSIFAVGSGVITDLTRYVASRAGREFVSVPTAASMDGYASGVAVMEFSGMKTTFVASPPLAIFAEPRTIAAAPLEMTRAGVGDLLGKASARADWLASHLLYGEYLCPEVEARVDQSLVQAYTHISDILAGSLEATAAFLSGLIESGIAIAMVGSSRPASGSEHQVSHFLDFLAAKGLRNHAPHGLQVGYATRFTTQLQLRAYGGGVLELARPRPITSDSDELRELFRGHETQLDEVMEQKSRFVSEHATNWPDTTAGWQSVEERVAEALKSFSLVGRALSLSGIPAEAGFLDLGVPMLKTSLRWANRIRPRYTVLDFLEGQGLLDQGIDELFGALEPSS